MRPVMLWSCSDIDVSGRMLARLCDVAYALHESIKYHKNNNGCIGFHNTTYWIGKTIH